jgi:hypothetical protein
VTLNLPVEEIPIVSPPPTPTPSLTPTATPTPTPMSFQNFEPDNGTPGDYCQEVWFAKCSFESTVVREGGRAVRVHAHAEAGGAGNGGTVGIYPSSSGPIDLSSATTLSVWVYDTQGNNDVELKLRDYNDALSNKVWSEMHAEHNNWTEITWSLSGFTGVDLSQITSIELYEWWDGVYYFDAVSWESIPGLESMACSYQADTDAETIVRLIQAESEAVSNEDKFSRPGLVLTGMLPGSPVGVGANMSRKMDFQDPTITHLAQITGRSARIALAAGFSPISHSMQAISRSHHESSPADGQSTSSGTGLA